MARALTARPARVTQGSMDLTDWVERHVDPSFDELDEPSAPWRPDRSAFEYGAIRVDRDALQLAQLCAGWAHRGLALEDLVGVAYGCACHPKVIPREQIAGRLGPGPLLDALSTAAPERGRLTVVATEWSGYGSHPTYTTHRIAIPHVDVPDTRGVLGRSCRNAETSCFGASKS